MQLILKRNTFTDKSTIGSMFVGGSRLSMPPDMLVYTLEDTKREHKIYGETCIPAGTYKLALRTEGGMNDRYAQKYPWHQGMIWLLEVPLFEYIYIHVGNYPSDTLGCLLVGKTQGDDFIGGSRAAYEMIYSTIVDAICSPEGCFITIED